MKNKNNLKLESKLVHLGNDPTKQYGYVSPPIYRGSTAIYDDVSCMKAKIKDPFKTTFPNYGRFGSPNARAFEVAMSELEQGHNAVITGSGLSAITSAILAFVKSGDHILMVDSVYWPGRNFCDSLRRFNITTEFYNPRIGSDIEKLIRTNTSLVYLESPGSLTFEVQDVETIASICRSKNIKTLIDNTWATPIYFQPLKLGVDVSIHSCTKYITGHADAIMGVAVCNEAAYSRVKTQAIELGQYANDEDVFFALRGLRTLHVRLAHHYQQALKMAQWLESQPIVKNVLYPPLPSHPDHHVWKKQFTGASGLLGFVIDPKFSIAAVEKMIDSLNLFSLGHSWGGFESLIVISDPSTYRTKDSWTYTGALIRIHVGVENINDLIADLEKGFLKLQAER